MNIDAKDLRLGRLATVVAKKALLGEDVNVFNCDKVVITGSRSMIEAKARQRREMGTHSTGPFHHRVPFKYVKRAIRGMLPYKKVKGRTAFDRIMWYNNIPAEFQDKKIETIPEAHVDSSMAAKFMYVKEICKFMGGK